MLFRSSYLPTYFLNAGFQPILTDITGKIVNLSNFYGQWWGTLNHHSLPVVYRGVEDGIFSQSSDSILALRTHKDIVYWMMDNWINYDGVVLSMRALDINDTIVNNIVNPAGWYVYPNYWIESLTKPLSHPTISQGRSSIQSGNWSFAGYSGDSNVVVNFKAMPSGMAVNPPVNIVGDLWQLPQGFNTLNPYSNYYWLDSANYYSSPKARKLIFKGKTPQLCALPYTRWKSDWYYNRRVFNANDNMPPSMIASIDQFARKTEEDEETANVFTGYASQRGIQLLTPFTLSDQNGHLTYPVFHSFKKVGDRFVPSDTITSGWFNINNLNTTHFFTRGNGILNSLLMIERQKDGKKILVPNALTSGNKILKNRLIFINGGNNKFRLKLIKIDSTARYTESLIIANLPVDDELNSAFDSSRFGKVIAYENTQLIDLGDAPEQTDSKVISLSLFPNPADENVYTTAYLPLSAFTGRSQHQMIIKVFSSLGFELFRQEVKSGETISIPTKDYPQGAYFIRAEEKADDYTIDVLPAKIQGFVIKR